MKSIYYKSKLYAPVISKIREQYGVPFTNALLHKADQEYMRMELLVGSVPKEHKQHLHNVLERGALYAVLKKKFPENAYEMVYAPSHKRNVKTNRLIARITRYKIGAKLFIRLMYRLGDTVFSEKTGHKKQWKVREKQCAAFDMLECPYVTYCKMVGLPELSKSFCDDDIEVFSNLPNIKYTRPQTIGNGAEKCDFRMELIK